MGAKALGVVPGSDSLHYVLQRHVTRSLPTSWPVARGHPSERAPRAREPHTQPSQEEPARTHACREPSRARPGPPLRSRAELETRFGIRYLAPCDARATGLPSASVDFASSTSTLEHIPEPDIVPILAECRRLLRPDGVLSARIDMRDHFAYADPGVSPYSFLRYSPRVWRLLNSRLYFRNRLRLPNHLRLIEAAGIRARRGRRKSAGRESAGGTRSVPVADAFRGYSGKDLATSTAFVIARPAGRG